MPQKLRKEFLNWAPDREDFGNDGLVKATNVVHDSEGWRPVHIKTTTSFSTTGGLAASNATIVSIVAQPTGSVNDIAAAWISNDGTTSRVHIGVNGVTATPNTTGYPTANTFSTLGTAQEITAFDVCTLEDRIFFAVEARQENASPATTESLAFVAYSTVVSLPY